MMEADRYEFFTTHYNILLDGWSKMYADKNDRVVKYLYNSVNFKMEMVNSNSYYYVSVGYPDNNNGFWVIGYMYHRDSKYHYIKTKIKYDDDDEVIEYLDNIGNWYNREIFSEPFPYKKDNKKLKELIPYIQHMYDATQYKG